MNWFVSPSTSGFYPIELRADYEAAGTWPDDLIPLSEHQYAALREGLSAGSVLSFSSRGVSLVGPAPPSDEQLVIAASAKRDLLLGQAAVFMAPLQDASDLGVATEGERERLLAWKQYRVALGRIGQQPSFPHHIDWPLTPHD